jgi:hypothetical protein
VDGLDMNMKNSTSTGYIIISNGIENERDDGMKMMIMMAKIVLD